MFDFDKKKKTKDDDLDNSGLFESEKEKVKDGLFDSWNFEEDETEEDDYYDEDE